MDPSSNQKPSTIYRPLSSKKSIRLIDLEVGEYEAEIRCSLTTWDLSTNPMYAALSYTWGDPLAVPYRTAKPSKVVWCNGESLLITANLYEALLKLRGFRMSVNASTLLLWIDAICINQDDQAERGDQVAIMGEIYAKASAVISWLGHEDKNAKVAIKMINDILLPVAELWEAEGEDTFAYTFNDPTLFKRLRLPLVTPEEWEAFILFFERQYFHRCWIVQEVSLSGKAVVMCGPLLIEWRRITKVSQFLICSGWIPLLETFNKSRTIPGPTMAVPGILTGITFHCLSTRPHCGAGQGNNWNQFQTAKAYAFLELLLFKTHYFQATDPRDNIFAVLSIVSYIYQLKEPKVQFMRPNYSMPVQDVFVAITSDIIMNTQRVQLLSLAQNKADRRVPGLPSWVPDFSAFSTPFAGRVIGKRRIPCFRRNYGVFPHFNFEWCIAA